MPALLCGTDLCGPFVYWSHLHRGSGLDFGALRLGGWHRPWICGLAVVFRRRGGYTFEAGKSVGTEFSDWLSYSLRGDNPVGFEEQALWLIEL